MSHEPEFVRGNQKSYIRIPCDVVNLKSHEYQMCSYNNINSLLRFQQRSQNGLNYLYYEISGMQSLDIYLQTQKLKRSFAIQLAKAIVKLCRDLSEYALDVEKVIFVPKYIMIAANGGEVRFLYSYVHSEKDLTGLEKLLEGCIEYLDYQDELLMEKMFGLYERLIEQKENFLLDVEMDTFREALMEPIIVDIAKETDRGSMNGLPNSNRIKEIIVEEDCDRVNASEIGIKKGSKTAQKEYRGLKKGLLILLILDIAVLVFWKPLNMLKIFFAIAGGGVLLWLNLRVNKRDRKQKEQQQEQKQEAVYMEEYENLAKQNTEEYNYTQFIVVEDSEGILYNLQGCEPKCIHISDSQKIIGKDLERAQVQMLQEGISRVHALIVKEGENCIIEDLNSTNGTWINGKPLEPRTRYVLKQGDKVRFAGLEYIFR